MIPATKINSGPEWQSTLFSKHDSANNSKSSLVSKEELKFAIKLLLDDPLPGYMKVWETKEDWEIFQVRAFSLLPEIPELKRLIETLLRN